MHEPATTVCVVIVNYNSGSLIRRCLDALELQTRPPDRILIADNGSSDGSAAGLQQQYRRVELLALGRNLGFAAANNIAVRQAEGTRWVALLNPDAFPEPDWLEQMLAASVRHPDTAFFGCRLLNAERPDIIDGDGDIYHVSGAAWRRHHGVPLERVTEVDEEVFSPCAGAALYDRDAFLSIGGFDTRYFCYLEDVDLGFRLRLAGFQARQVGAAVVHHVGSAIAGAHSEFSLYHIQRNLVWTFIKNMPYPLILRYLPQHLLLNLLGVLALARRGQGKTALRAKLDALRGLPAGLRERKQIQRERKVSNAALLRVMGSGLLAPYRRDKDKVPQPTKTAVHGQGH